MDASAYQQQDRIGVLDELLNERYSVRAFLPQPVPHEIIEHVLATAQRTASWCNSQPWQVLIASGEAKERFRKLIYQEAASGAEDGHDFPPPREYLGVYLDRRRESGFQLYNTLGIVRGDKAAYGKQALENYNFFGAPHVAIIHTDEPLGIYGAIDCGAYVSNFMLARSEEHTSEPSHVEISYAVFCLKKKKRSGRLSRLPSAPKTGLDVESSVST